MISIPTSSFYATTVERALPLYTTAQLRALEAATAQTLPPYTLMARAGDAATSFICQHSTPEAQNRIWIAAGPGNNGGDALVTATELRRRGQSVEVCLPVRVKTEDARHALENARAAEVPITDALPGESLDAYEWVIDGLFGLGLTRSLESPYAQLAHLLSQHSERGGNVLALDIPSGLNGDTGTGMNGGPIVKATHTLTFIGAKAGLYTAQGRDYAGEIWLAPLGLEAGQQSALRAFSKHPAWLNAPALFRADLPVRPHASHKGNYGRVLVLGGSTGMMGASILAARAALFAGAGKIHVALIGKGCPAYDPLYPELMFGNADTFDASDADVSIIGCGLGQDRRARAVCADALAFNGPKIIDADALNLIACYPDFAARLAGHQSTVVLTPHPLEAARLLRCDVDTVQRDRLAAAHTLATQYTCSVALKGSGTVIASSDGRLVVNPTGHAGLATSGSGDTLSGFIGALMAQHMPPFEATLAAVFLHGQAAETLANEGIGPTGLNAGALIPSFRRLLNATIHCS